MFNKKRGFTIIEVIIATFILTVGALGVFSTIQFVLMFTRSVSLRLGAVYLAQGGIEIVRNIRDSNWLEKRYNASIVWDDGIPAGTWCLVAGIPVLGCPSEIVGDFARIITVSKPQPDQMTVSVQVLWIERGGSPSTMSSVMVATDLYDWK